MGKNIITFLISPNNDFGLQIRSWTNGLSFTFKLHGTKQKSNYQAQSQQLSGLRNERNFQKWFIQ